jgi:hypothetical protein
MIDRLLPSARLNGGHHRTMESLAGAAGREEVLLSPARVIAKHLTENVADGTVGRGRQRAGRDSISEQFAGDCPDVHVDWHRLEESEAKQTDTIGDFRANIWQRIQFGVGVEVGRLGQRVHPMRPALGDSARGTLQVGGAVGKIARTCQLGVRRRG